MCLQYFAENAFTAVLEITDSLQLCYEVMQSGRWLPFFWTSSTAEISIRTGRDPELVLILSLQKSTASTGTQFQIQTLCVGQWTVF